MKRVLILSLVILLTLSMSSLAVEDEIKLIIGGTEIVYDEDTGSPFIDVNNRTQVPLRKTMESYGATVGWDASNQSAIVSKGNTQIVIPIGENHILVNGEEKLNDTAAIIIEGRTYLPIRVVIESLGGIVTWDQRAQTVTIMYSLSYGSTQEVTDETFDKDVLKTQGFVIVDVGAEWCGYCKIMDPIYEELAEAYPTIKFLKIDADENKIIDEYGAKYLPTFLFFKDGEHIDTMIGAQEKEQFEKKLDELLAQ